MLVGPYRNHTDWTIKLIQNNPKGTKHQQGNQLLTLAQLESPRSPEPQPMSDIPACLCLSSLWCTKSALLPTLLCLSAYLCQDIFLYRNIRGQVEVLVFHLENIALINITNFSLSWQTSVAMLTWISQCLVCCIHSAALVLAQ